MLDVKKKCCPGCGVVAIYYKKWDHAYKCRQCNLSFQVPTIKVGKSKPGPKPKEIDKKKCGICGIGKLAGDYYKYKNGHLDTYCKACRTRMMQLYRVVGKVDEEELLNRLRA